MTRWAHSVNANGVRQTLRDHLLGTALLASRFGTEFGAKEAAYAVGLLHDAGKISDEWQKRLLTLESGHAARRADHKELGALLSSKIVRSPGVFAIDGHHGGIPDRPNCHKGVPDAALVEQLVMDVPEVGQLLQQGCCVPSSWAESRELVEFGTRMLHSALVDADFLDTAAHFAGTKPTVQPDADFQTLFTKFETARVAELRHRKSTALDQDRQRLFDAALTAAGEAQGVFRMSAPTGSGKTFAAAGFALRHAAAKNLRRVVVAVPFTTITEQNAAAYRRLLGEDVVLEHHSAVEPSKMAGYGVENWDAPFIVTTTVQLFESLFSNRPAKTRKLHRLCNAVIVLDEVQALPKHLLNPILDALRLLVSDFGTTVLLASATQPTFEVLDAWRRLNVAPREIVSDPPALYRRLTRVTYEWQPQWRTADLVSHVADEHASLTVVNTTAAARELATELQSHLGDSVFHLSTRMCRAHRAEVLERVRQGLAAEEPVHLVSTQLIEAGVDIDFPVVFRQEAPAESIIQAGGRSNREGRLKSGRVVVFSGPDFPQIREYRTGISLTTQHFAATPGLLNDPSALRRYFAQLFALQNLDESAAELQRLRHDLWFAGVAERFRMIDSSTTSVLVDWCGAHAGLEADLSDQMRSGRDTIPMSVLRRLQPFLVDLPSRLASVDYAAYLLERAPGVFVWTGPYSPLTGVGSTEPAAFVF